MRNFGRRMHHMALAVQDGHVVDEKNVDYVVRQLAEMGTPFLAHVVGECKDDPNLKQIFSKSSRVLAAHHRVHRALPPLRGLLHARQRGVTDRGGGCRRALRARPRLRLRGNAAMEKVGWKVLWLAIALALAAVGLAFISPWFLLLELIFVPLVAARALRHHPEEAQHPAQLPDRRAHALPARVDGAGAAPVPRRERRERPAVQPRRALADLRAREERRGQEAVRHRARRLRARLHVADALDLHAADDRGPGEEPADDHRRAAVQAALLVIDPQHLGDELRRPRRARRSSR